MAGSPPAVEPDGVAEVDGAPPPPNRKPRSPLGALARSVGALRSRVGRVTRRLVRLALVYGLLAAISLAGGLVVVAIAAEYGYQPNRDAAGWAALVPRYAEAGSCASCHSPEAGRIVAASHADVSCETCHGPLEGHALAPTAAAVELPEAGSDEPICLTCHEAVIGRPLTFPVVSSVTHFPLPACTVCHDPHEPAAMAPPDIRHSLDRLPECAVCHRVDGIRPLPEQHPTWDGDCRACHRSAQALGS